MLTAAQRPLAMLIRYAVHFVDPEAEVILYGSQARGEANKWSDWDVVVIRNTPVTNKYWGSIVDAIYMVELSTNEVITATVLHREEWLKTRTSSFYKNVEKDGIALETVSF